MQRTDQALVPTLARKTDILGIAVSRTDYREASSLVVDAARKRIPLAVSALAVHGLMTGVLDRRFGRILNHFDVLAPDGQPVRWALNVFGRPRLKDRVYGPRLMLDICERAETHAVGIYLFGSTEAVVAALQANLKQRFPRLIIAGAQPDRFRDATPQEDAEDVKRIAESGAGIVFCGRGCPRQERWCDAHRDRIAGACVAVGAAFDFHAGTLKQAPSWMQRAGLEWAFRLLCEPRRLWRRYLLLNPLFVICILLQILGLSRCFRRPPHPAD
ncbi:MAG: WecB/TagA/CpsF family glycosyltransferase [Kiritimatiellae bacterium]|nr:WecB/TagA/CpsF family glycosyltransferase [Kiritimatiellia bacterium]